MADQMTTPDPTLAARLDAMLEPALQYDSAQDELHGALDTAYRSRQLITLADHEAAVAKAVEAATELKRHFIPFSEAEFKAEYALIAALAPFTRKGE